MAMGNQSSISSVLTETHAMVGEPLQSRKRLLDLPERKGVEPREVVLEEFRRANSYLDLTCDSDNQPALKVRKVGLQNHETVRGSREGADGIPVHLKPLTKNELPRANKLVEYTGSRNGSAAEEDSKMTQKNTCITNVNADDIKNIREEESASGNIPGFQPRPEKMPFVDEGYGSFSASQEREIRFLDLAEAELAEQLIISDRVRGSGNGLDDSCNEMSRPSTSNSITQNAIAWKEKIEREGAEKSRALREAAKKQNGLIVGQHRLEHIPDLSHLDSHAGNCSPSTHTISGGTSTVSASEDSDPDGRRCVEIEYEEALLYESQKPAPITETTPATGEHMNLDATNSPPRVSGDDSTYTRYADTQSYGTSKDVKPEPFPSRLDNSTFVDICDLEEGAQILDAYTKLSERQNAGPKTKFTPRHKLDAFNCSYKQVPVTDFSSTPRQKFHSPYGEPVRRTSKPLRTSEGSNELLDLAHEEASETLHRAPNRNGGLAMLAQKAGVEDDAPVTHSAYVSANARQNGELNRTYRSTTISASEFCADFSRYTIKLNQKERDLITRHEWLKERQRDLRTLKATYIEVARLSCITGVTKRMEDELAKTDEFKEIVLEQGKTDKAKRNRVQAIKANMVSRQTYDVPAERMEENLGLFVDRRSLQRMDDELERIETEMESVGYQRREESTKRGTRGRSHKKKVRFAFADTDREASKPRPRTLDTNIIDLPQKSEVARPKFDTEENRQSQSAAYWKSEAEKETILREKLKTFDELTTEPLVKDVDRMSAAAQIMNKAEEDLQSEVSEEDEGFEMYSRIESASLPSMSKPLPKTTDASLADQDTLDEQCKGQEILALPDPISKAANHAPASAQAPDLALAEQMRRAHLGIPEQDENIETLSDAGSNTSGESGDEEAQMVNNYIVYGCYTGISELEDCTPYRMGRFLRKENAEALIGEKVIEFCSARKRDIMAAAEKEDEEWLTRLGDPEDGTLKHNMKTKEQFVEFPASSCRLWMEMERVKAKSRAERETVVSMCTNTYVALFERTFADGSKETPSWDELITCGGPNGVWFANQEACRIMSRWYGEHMKDGYLAMQEAALEEKVRELGEEGLFDEEEEFQVPGGKESMRVWVDWKRNKG
jgi:hypothetical protein